MVIVQYTHVKFVNYAVVIYIFYLFPTIWSFAKEKFKCPKLFENIFSKTLVRDLVFFLHFLLTYKLDFTLTKET